MTREERAHALIQADYELALALVEPHLGPTHVVRLELQRLIAEASERSRITSPVIKEVVQ